MIRAIPFVDQLRHREAAIPGSIYFDSRARGGTTLQFFCPCGCGQMGTVSLTPDAGWNGAETNPPFADKIGLPHRGCAAQLSGGYWEPGQ
ncbi:MAG: DUF6527 family protein [Marinovum algicola]|jgi:hypothetical protein|uniref:hypothetical protein n=1 Tax=Marinovum algicola TaxID=42444 RepID=UPI0032EC25CE